MDLRATIRAIPDHPKPGIVFRDVTTLMGDPDAFASTVRLLAEAFKAHEVSKVAGIEARGFVFGAALADRLGAGFVPVRKLGKLPAETVRRSYLLEYGEDTLEVHKDAVTKGERTLLVDDLLATGGTALAGAHLLQEIGAEIAACAFVVEIEGLGGRAVLEQEGHDVFSLMRFQDEG
jgi:adenine phosphoribosyltransferase